MRATFRDESTTQCRMKSLPAEGMPSHDRVGVPAPPSAPASIAPPPPRVSEIRPKAKPPLQRKPEVVGGAKEEMVADLRRDPRYEG